MRLKKKPTSCSSVTRSDCEVSGHPGVKPHRPNHPTRPHAILEDPRRQTDPPSARAVEGTTRPRAPPTREPS